MKVENVETHTRIIELKSIKNIFFDSIHFYVEMRKFAISENIFRLVDHLNLGEQKKLIQSLLEKIESKK